MSRKFIYQILTFVIAVAVPSIWQIKSCGGGEGLLVTSVYPVLFFVNFFYFTDWKNNTNNSNWKVLLIIIDVVAVLLYPLAFFGLSCSGSY